MHSLLGIYQARSLWRKRGSHKHLSQVTAGEIPYKSQICLPVTMNKTSHSTQERLGGCSHP